MMDEFDLERKVRCHMSVVEFPGGATAAFRPRPLSPKHREGIGRSAIQRSGFSSDSMTVYSNPMTFFRSIPWRS